MIVRCVIDNRVRIYGELPEEVGKRLRAAFEHANPQRAKLERMGFPVWKEPRVLVTWRDEGDHLSFARGGYRRVREILDEELVVRVSDRRCAGEAAAGEREIPDYRRGLWAHQRLAVDSLIARENCLLRAATGSGKTSVALAIVARLKVPTIVVVWSGALFDQWIERIGHPEELGMRQRDIGMVRGGVRKIRPVTVAMQQTLARGGVDEELRVSFGCLVFDEAHASPAATAYTAIDQFPARYRFGISANIARKDGKEALTYDLFGKEACEITNEEVVASGHVLDVEVRVVPTRFEAPWWNPPEQDSLEELVEGEVASVVEKTVARDFGRLLAEMMADGEREAKIDEVVIAEARAGCQVLVLTRRRDHVLAIDQRISAAGIRTGIMLGGGGEDERVRRQTMAGLRSGKIRVAVATIEAVGTGVDLPTVEVGVLALPILGNRPLFGQVRGRICRTSAGKTGARLYVLDDERVLSVVGNLLKWNKTVRELQGGKWVQVVRKRRD